jgi:hypothetical protein
LYIPDGLKFSIKVFDKFGHMEHEIPLNPSIFSKHPILFGDIMVKSNDIYLTDTLNSALYYLDKNGKLKKNINFKRLNCGISSPFLIFSDGVGRIYVNDRKNMNLVIFSDNSFKKFRILKNIENPYILKDGTIVSTHIINKNHTSVITLLDNDGKFKPDNGMNMVEGLAIVARASKADLSEYRTIEEVLDAYPQNFI